MADVQDLAALKARDTTRGAFATLHPRQDRIADATESLSDQGRADGPRWLARAQCDHAPAPAPGNGGLGQQIAQEIDDVAHVVLRAEPGHHVGEDLLAIGLGEADGAADARVKAVVFGERRRDAAFAQVDLDQDMRLGPIAWQLEPVAN